MEFGLWLLAAYLLGSVNSAIGICKLFGLEDPRLQGSGNPGASNVLRVGGRVPALLTLVLDVSKGAVPVFLALNWGPQNSAAWVLLCACVGHCYPLFHGGQGGKAVATAAGGIAVLKGYLFLALLGVWIGVFYFSRIASAASLASTLLLTLSSYWLWPAPGQAIVLLSLLIVVRHKDNIQRLFRGEENRFKGP